MRYLTAITMLLVLLGGCKARIFTDVSVELKNLEDVFPGEFRGETLELRRKDSALRMGAREYLVGLYGAQASFQAWEFDEPPAAKEALANLERQKKEETMQSFSSERSTEYRFDYTLEAGEAGIMFTNKVFLFAIEAPNYDRLVEFLKVANIARIQ